MPGLLVADTPEESKSLGHLKEAAVFDNLIHAFSLLDFYAAGPRQTWPTYAAARYENHPAISQQLKLLNSLALLLIKQPRKEAVATSFDITTTGVIFHWARNDNKASAIEKAYVDKLLDMAKTSAHDGDML